MVNTVQCKSTPVLATSGHEAAECKLIRRTLKSAFCMQKDSP